MNQQGPLRSFLYALAALMGDAKCRKERSVGRRVGRRLAGKATGRGLGNPFK